MEEVDEGMSFCRDHGRMLNRQLIDKCPKCGRYKDARQKHCPDCNYGRPVADWKVSSRNLEEVTEYIEPAPPPEPVVSSGNPVSDLPSSTTSQPARGEAMCPSCGSVDLAYKEVFDYFRCNACDTTFVTPVYSYGETGFTSGGTPPQPVNRQNVIKPPVQQPRYRREEPYIQQPPQPQPPPPPPPPQPPTQWQDPRVQQQPSQWLGTYAQQPPVQWQEPQVQPPPVQREEPRPPAKKSPWPLSSGKIPNLDIMRRHELEERAINQRAIKTQGQKSNLGWIYLLIVICIIALIALLGWFFLNDQILSVIDSIS
ncbi:MAG: hypothetical protein JSU79_03160 [Dehalococcoidales bacterium]|nr:MAG: hypothetical protein JSU79_03160 [Dehalococcoidales bacterium]